MGNIRFVAIWALFFLSVASLAVDERSADVASRFADAINKKDVAGVADTYAEDGVLMPPNAPMIRGREEIRHYWEQALQQGVAVTVLPLSIVTSGNGGHEVLTYELSVSQGDTQSTEKGKSIVILKRGKDRKWRMAYDIWNSDSPPPSK